MEVTGIAKPMRLLGMTAFLGVGKEIGIRGGAVKQSANLKNYIGQTNRH